MNKFAFMVVLGIAPAVSFGAGCEDYPYSEGINIEDVAGGTKILATGQASVSFDDIDAVRDAKDEATLVAKAAISKFLTETIAYDEAINKAVNETKSMSRAGKENQREEVINRVKSLRNSSKSLLRGVVPLADCYTKGQFVRVSVGLKPETIKTAGNLAGGISKSVGSTPTPTSQSANTVPPSDVTTQSSASMPHQGVESHSNTSRLNNF